MTWDIGFVLLVLVAMVYLFMTEKLPVELTAFIGLLVLVFTGYVPVEGAFEGFSSPAVMTMFAIFFISGALLRTGVAESAFHFLWRASAGYDGTSATDRWHGRLVALARRMLIGETFLGLSKEVRQ